MSYDAPLSREDLQDFFAVTDRGLPRVLSAQGIRLVNGKARWPVVLRAMGFDEQRCPDRLDELMQPLLTAQKAAPILGVRDSSTVYKWVKGNAPKHLGPMPKPIRIWNGKKTERDHRWRRAELEAWICEEAQPVYVRLEPAFGALPGRKGGAA
ncbi:MAG: hypothetical protein HWE26_19615 [Alteromonadaceae bacterium]|nr:hypothetical protein [Alteromonadaceae bacterium]